MTPEYKEYDMTASPREIAFYFDFISPYAYFAAVRLEPWRQQLPMEVKVSYKPVLFAAFLNHWEHKGPAEIPPKRVFTYKDTVRQAARLGLSLKFPPAHPFNPLLPLRLAVALDGDPRLHDVILDVYHAAWRDGLDITDPAVLQRRLHDLSVSEPEALLARCGEPAVKQALRENTEGAIAAGVFGVPTFVVDKELFWGCTQFEYIEDYLMGRDPVQTQGRAQKIAEHPVGAAR